MANEFYARKGLAIATSSVALTTANNRFLVLGEDNIVRYRTDVAGNVGTTLPYFSVQLSSAAGLTGYGLVDHSNGNVAFNEPGGDVAFGVGRCMTLFGACAGLTTVATGSTFIGYKAGFGTNNAVNNTFIGANAGSNVTNNNACGNTFVGFGAGSQQTSVCNSVLIGANAGCSMQTNTGNVVAIGHDSGRESGSDSTYIGFKSGCKNTAAENTFIGSCSGCGVTSGSSNTFIGAKSGTSTSTGTENTFIGNNAGSTSTASKNVYIGTNAGQNNATGNNNVHIGFEAGKTGNWTSTIAIGSGAAPTANNQLVIASATNFIGTASSGTFSYFLTAKINGVDFKIPLYT
jgi:hypothetical protein